MCETQDPLTLVKSQANSVLEETQLSQAKKALIHTRIREDPAPP